VIEPLRLEIVPWPKAPDLRKERLMNAPTSAAAARKPLAVRSELEAEISNLLEQEGQKPPVQMEDDGERIRSLVGRLTSNSIDELEGLGSDLTSAVRQLQEFLKSEGERVQREIVNYAHLTETTLAAIKTIIETTFRPAHRATSPWVDSKRAP
jgi:gas vesicle protein